MDEQRGSEDAAANKLFLTELMDANTARKIRKGLEEVLG